MTAVLQSRPGTSNDNLHIDRICKSLTNKLEDNRYLGPTLSNVEMTNSSTHNNPSLSLRDQSDTCGDFHLLHIPFRNRAHPYKIAPGTATKTLIPLQIRAILEV